MLKRKEQQKPESIPRQEKLPQSTNPQFKMPPPSNDEFAMMWNQLQAPAAAAKGPSLSQAARTLPDGPSVPNTNRHGGTGRTRPSKDSGPSGTKIDLQQMFEAAKKEKSPAVVEVSEIEKMFQAASIEPLAAPLDNPSVTSVSTFALQ